LIRTWREAHQVARIAAQHALVDLEVLSHLEVASHREVPSYGYVDVFGAIRAAGVPMMLQRLPRLFGLFVGAASDGPGILLNSGLPLAALRHTAAHELGHFRFGHGDSLDVNLDAWSGQAPPGGWTGDEMLAEAFAAWFLMPRRAVLATLTALGLRRPGSAVDVYRLATLLGASYRGLCRHLVMLRLANEADVQTWARTGRRRLRRQLAGAAAESCRGDVIIVESRIAVHAGFDDLLVLPGNPASDPGPGLERIDVEFGETETRPLFPESR
jgi:hypothetical protein